jgi:hypothetical protein
MASSTSSELVPQLSRSEAKSALVEVIAAMNEPNNRALMTDAKHKSDSSVCQTGQHFQMSTIRHMQFVFPIATQILMDVISNYGFAKSGEGVIQFTIAVKDMERVDEEIARLNSELRTYFLPNFQTLATNSSIH